MRRVAIRYSEGIVAKKKKKKFKKKLKAQIIQELARTKPASETAAPKEEAEPRVSVKSTPLIQPARPEETKPLETVSVQEDQVILGTNVAIVKSDLKKIALLFGAMILILVIVFIIDQRTSLFVDLSKSISQLLHFS